MFQIKIEPLDDGYPDYPQAPPLHAQVEQDNIDPFADIPLPPSPRPAQVAPTVPANAVIEQNMLDPTDEISAEAIPVVCNAREEIEREFIDLTDSSPGSPRATV